MLENLDQNQIILIVTIMTASAVIVGFMAGLFGIGGGLIMVPILFYIYSFVGVEQKFIMHLALGTSFSIIIPTFNNFDYLKICLGSIQKNSEYSHEIVLHINDGSDGTLSYVKSNNLKSNI